MSGKSTLQHDNTTKKAIITLSPTLLEMALGFKTDWNIVAAQIKHNVHGVPMLQLIIEGESLHDDFTVKHGQVIKEGDITLHRTDIQAEVMPHG